MTYPVSQFVNLPKSGAAASNARDALTVIDSVHEDGQPPIHILKVVSRAGYKGAYLPRFLPNGPGLRLKASGSTPHLTTAHEIGHLLDLEAFGTGHSIVASSAEFLDWRNAVGNSAIYTKIQDDTNNLASLSYLTAMDELCLEYLEYLMEPAEWWARSYAQYIAETSANTEMLRQLATLRSDAWQNGQWSRPDFVPVRNAITDIFRLRGWI